MRRTAVGHPAVALLLPFLHRTRQDGYGGSGGGCLDIEAAVQDEFRTSDA